MVDKQTDGEAVTHEVYTALIETAKSLHMAPDRLRSQRQPQPRSSMGRASHVDKMAALMGRLEPLRGEGGATRCRIDPQAEHPEVHARWFLPW